MTGPLRRTKRNNWVQRGDASWGEWPRLCRRQHSGGCPDLAFSAGAGITNAYSGFLHMAAYADLFPVT
jgi:hypothetical protein